MGNPASTHFRRITAQVFAPIPSASVIAAIAVKAGLLAGMRTPKRTSCQSCSSANETPHFPRFFRDPRYVAKLAQSQHRDPPLLTHPLLIRPWA